MKIITPLFLRLVSLLVMLFPLIANAEGVSNAERLESIENLNNLKANASHSDIAIAMIEQQIYMQSLLLSKDAKVASCAELLAVNPYMQTGAYVLHQDGADKSFICEIESGMVTAQSENNIATETNCIISNSCLRAPETFLGDIYSEQMEGTNIDDILNGTDRGDLILAYQGDDVIYAGGGDDELRGGDGSDTLNGGSGNDLIYSGNGSDRIFGGRGEDALYGDLGDDYLAGGDHNDVLSGGQGDDLLEGDSGDDYLLGDNGSDFLVGGSGVDYLKGGNGRDFLLGGHGDDRLEGGEGHDDLHGLEGRDDLYGNGENDLIYGNEGADRLTGGAGHDRLHGGDDDDLLFGDDGTDLLDGGAGNDYLDGGTGNDFLFGGEGNDTLLGGDGPDVFIFYPGSGRDVINEFDLEQDRIDIRFFDLDRWRDLKRVLTCYGQHNRPETYCVIRLNANDHIAIMDAPLVRSLMTKSVLNEVFMFEFDDETQANRDFVTDTYERYFGRVPAFQGYHFWMGYLKNHTFEEAEREIIYGASREDQVHIIANTAEAARSFLTSNGFDVPEWLQPGNSPIEQLINSLYVKYFDRSLSENDMVYWVNQSLNLTNRELEAYIIYGAQQGDKNHLCGYTHELARNYLLSNDFAVPAWIEPAAVSARRDTVNGFYASLFNRTAEEGGLGYWSGQICSSTETEVKRDMIYSASDFDRQNIIDHSLDSTFNFLRENAFGIPHWLIDAADADYSDIDKENFINTKYLHYFGRYADDAGLSFYLEHLVSRGLEPTIEASIIIGAADIDRVHVVQNRKQDAIDHLQAYGFDIPEWLQESADETPPYGDAEKRSFIQSVYIKYFDRYPDEDGMNAYLDALESIDKQIDVEYWIITGAVGSDRNRLISHNASKAIAFLNNHGFAVPSWLSGAINPPSRPDLPVPPEYSEEAKIEFLQSVYRKYFGRTADNIGINLYLVELTGPERENQVEAWIITGALRDDKAYLVRFKGAQARNFLQNNGFTIPNWLTWSTHNTWNQTIEQIYSRYFGRTPDQAGKDFWRGQLAVFGASFVEREIIYGANDEDKARLNSSSSRRDAARRFLQDNGYSVPDWIE
ncbi:calcium-binding protein [Ningiella sp. W23]|uniref:calcium-binding protein n=1 Tax=Ningiella sp. W23 TaxID=3023715 RepID=UPI0037576BE3